MKPDDAATFGNRYRPNGNLQIPARLSLPLSEQISGPPVARDPGQKIYRRRAIPVAKEVDDLMSPSREEIDAKLATVEARAETRFVELSGKLDRIAEALAAVRDDTKAVRSDNRFTRWTILGIAVASLLAGIAALWTTQANLLAAFQTGLTIRTSTAVPDATQGPKN
jgi:hypothetical protein